MKKYTNKLNLLLSLTVLLSITLACGGNQVADANKLVDEANKTIDEAKTLMTATEARTTKLFSVKVQNVAQFTYYRGIIGPEAKGIAEDYGKVTDKLNEVSKKFAEAAKLDVPDKYKEYLELKSKEFAKRVEGVNARKADVQAFLDTTNPAGLVDVFDKNGKTAQTNRDEAEDIAKKADKIKEDNKEIFKS